ncbi:MAG: demethoxyubiquinone hydroxylase family protein, partial [Pseudomonadota bacterium]
HAGEYGAVRIYQGQLDALKKQPQKTTQNALKAIEHMLAQEKEHLHYFNNKISTTNTRPTLWMGLWHHVGYGLGFISATLGSKHAMACTIAVEDEIVDHYQNQIQALDANHHELATQINRFCLEELEHSEQATLHEGGEAKMFVPFYHVVRKASKLAIWLSERF